MISLRFLFHRYSAACGRRCRAPATRSRRIVVCTASGLTVGNSMRVDVKFSSPIGSVETHAGRIQWQGAGLPHDESRCSSARSSMNSPFWPWLRPRRCLSKAASRATRQCAADCVDYPRFLLHLAEQELVDPEGDCRSASRPRAAMVHELMGARDGKRLLRLQRQLVAYNC
jgi:hypothetical protein